MAGSRDRTFLAGDVLLASQLNSLQDYFLNNALLVISPLTGSIDAAGFDITALDELAFNNAAANASAAGRLRRNVNDLTWGAGGTPGRLFYAGGTDVPVADGGTGLSSGTSGGILGYTATGTLASSILLTANALVLGGGAGATPTPLSSLGTTTTLLHGNATGAPTFSAVSLTADVSGDLPFANLTQGAALSVLGVTGNAIADVASIEAASDFQVLRRSGTALAFGAINLASVNAVSGLLANANLDAVGPGATGPIGSTTVTPVVTINAQGRVTALTSATISAFSVKIGSFTRDISLASGTQAITGVGFTPKAIVFLAGESGVANSYVSVGISDVTSDFALINDNAANAGKWILNTAQAIQFRVSGGTTAYSGQISSFESDGFTVTWAKDGTPTGTMTIAYLALA